MDGTVTRRPYLRSYLWMVVLARGGTLGVVFFVPWAVRGVAMCAARERGYEAPPGSGNSSVVNSAF